MPDSGSAPALYASRPRVFVEGSEEPALGQQLQGLFIEETADGLYRCEATFVNWGPKDGAVGFLYFDRNLLDFGVTIRVEMGAGEGAGKVFEGRITALEGRFSGGRPPELLVMAEDRLQDLRMTRRTRSWEQASDADVVRSVASAHGLRADVQLSGPTYAVITQVNQSDLALLRERCRAAGAELWVEGDTLKVKARADRDAGTLALTYGEGLHEFAVAADLAHQTTAFTVSGWDVSAKQAVKPAATASVVSAELNGGDSGSAILEASFGRRPQQVAHQLPLKEDEARALAEAHYARLARRFVSGNGVAEGDARLKVGAELELKQVGPLFEGTYFVTRVRHTFDTVNGYRTAFSVERPALGRAA